jgi:tol-pal system protein YbgF
LIADQGGQGGASQQTLAEANEADRLYQAALDAIKQGQFAGAQPLLQQFIDTYADHPLLQNAQYWMGETYYAQQDYNSAAAYFTRAYRQDDQGPKAPDSLLKLGFSLFALNKSNDGCKVLNALFEKHEAASQDVLSLAASTLSERGC